MNFDTLDSVRLAGFTGFLPPPELHRSNCSQIPPLPGIYLVLRATSLPPQFTPLNRGGHFKGRDPTLPISTLQARWVPGTAVLYIGKTAGDLRERIGQYIKYGYGKRVSHEGGRLIWQLADCDDLLLCWKEVVGTDPREMERLLIGEFVEKYGRLPFANLRH